MIRENIKVNFSQFEKVFEKVNIKVSIKKKYITNGKRSI